MLTAVIQSPLGPVEVMGDKDGLSRIHVLEDTAYYSTSIPLVLQEATSQLTGYFNGNLQDFDLQLNPPGTAFQKKVWQELQKIPFGETRSYLELAKQVGDVKAVRAVAAANGRNPLWLVVPCHRVIGIDGSLTGYAGGLWRKKWLLGHESQLQQLSLF